MTRKDYVKFAEMFKEEHDKCNIDNPGESAAVNTIVWKTAKIFHYDNPAFRPYQFFIACGYEKDAAALYASQI